MDFEAIATDRRPVREVVDGYTAWAPEYDGNVWWELDVPLLERVPPDFLKGHARAADLACGTGRMGEWLKGMRVGEVRGVDLTPGMLERARAKGVYAGLALEDMLHTSLPAGGQDLAITSLALCHVERLEPFYAEAARLLGPGGRLIVVDYHPHFLLNGVPTQFSTPDGGDHRIRNHVHQLSDHYHAAARRHFRLDHFDEQIVGASFLAGRPKAAKWLHHPISFLMTWTRP